MRTFSITTDVAALLVAAFVAFDAPVIRSSAAQKPPATGNALFGLTKLHRIHITIAPDEWAVLQTSSARGATGPAGSDYVQPDGRLVHVGSGFGGYFPWAHADLRVDDAGFKAEFRNVGLRYKGNLSFTRSTSAAPLFANFKLKIDLHGTKGSWDGEKTFNLHAGVVDTSKMRDAIAFALFRGAGVPAPRTAFVDIFVTVPGVYNDAAAGLFTIIEDVNNTLLERVLPPGTGLLMKPEGLRGGIQNLGDTWAPYIPKLRPDRDATPHEQRRVIEFSQLISQPDAAQFRAKIGDYLDVDEFLRYVLVNVFIMNNDSYIGGGHNYYLYLDPRDDKFRFIPWDEDLSMNGRGGAVEMINTIRILPPPGTAGAGNPTVDGRPVVVGPIMTNGGNMDIMRPYNGSQPLISQLLDDPTVNEQYRAIIRQMAASLFTSAELLRMVDAMEPIGTGRGPSPRAFLENRATQVQQLVAGWAGK